ncbi:MAG: hypothetical protein JNK35_11155 [Phycisphaerae bacterium]|nr:hypothetical protein [Phycisphaerae bacterium]
MKSGRTVAITWSVALISCSLIALAGPGDPGWEYGRLNCGKWAGITNYNTCLGCCDVAFANGTLNEAQWWDCKSYCAAVCWSCQEPPPDA